VFYLTFNIIYYIINQQTKGEAMKEFKKFGIKLETKLKKALDDDKKNHGFSIQDNINDILRKTFFPKERNITDIVRKDNRKGE